jgi:hypothetical protein
LVTSIEASAVCIDKSNDEQKSWTEITVPLSASFWALRSEGASL